MIPRSILGGPSIFVRHSSPGIRDLELTQAFRSLQFKLAQTPEMLYSCQ
jgi:hypothetical protein